jgi:hypothetical protein
MPKFKKRETKKKLYANKLRKQTYYRYCNQGFDVSVFVYISREILCGKLFDGYVEHSSRGK